MTRDEHRKECAQALMDGAAKAGLIVFPNEETTGLGVFLAAFDSLRSAGARVVPVEATEEMIKAGLRVFALWEDDPADYSAENLMKALLRAMSRVGDLGGKP